MTRDEWNKRVSPIWHAQRSKTGAFQLADHPQTSAALSAVCSPSRDLPFAVTATGHPVWTHDDGRWIMPNARVEFDADGSWSIVADG